MVFFDKGCFDVVVFNEVVDFIFDWIKNYSVWNYIFFKEGI